jgi:hypothetical protein
LATKKIYGGSRRTSGKFAVANFRPTASIVTFSANVEGNEDIYLHDLATGNPTALPIPKGVNEPCGRAFRVQRRTVNACSTTTTVPPLPAILWVHTNLATGKSQQTHAFTGRGRALRGYG